MRHSFRVCDSADLLSFEIALQSAREIGKKTPFDYSILAAWPPSPLAMEYVHN